MSETAEGPPQQGEDLVQRLCRLWQQGHRPELKAFLAQAGDLTPAQLAAVLRVDQHYRWLGRERVLAEAYLQLCPAIRADGEAALELIYAEFVYREDRGEAPSLEEYLGRFPEYGPRLEQQIALHQGLATASGLDLDGSACPVTVPPVSLPWQTLSLGQSADDRPVIPGYEILEELGRGGMGVVYKARQKGLQRLVALKMILAGYHAGPQELARFRTEAEAVARLRHPNIVQVHEIGERGGRPYFSLEFVDGGNLAQKLAGTPLAAAQAAELMETLARAVHYAHQRGVIHRDLKPANILLEAGNVPKVADFGLARCLEQEAHQTASGAIMGTPSYMAPEQAAGQVREVGPASDQYALGAILYELLTGRPPFKGTTVLDTLEQVRTQEPLSPSRLQPRVPRDLETICLKCLQKEPRKRYRDVGELADDLRRFREGQPIRARPVGPLERGVKWVRRRPAVASLIAAVLLVAVGAFAGIYSEWRRAEVQRDLLRRHLYDAHINLAQRAWEDGHVARVLDLLDLQRREGDQDLRGFEWYYLWRLCHSARFTGDGRSCVAFSPDGLRLAAAGAGHTAQAWDVRNLAAPPLVFAGHEGPVGCLAFSPDGRRLATGSEDRTVRLWDLATGKEVGCLRGHAARVSTLAFSPSGQTLASGSADRTVKLWDANTGVEARTLAGQKGTVTGLAFSPDGRTLATASVDGIELRNAATGEEIGHVHAHSSTVTGLAFSPDGRRLASAGADRTIKIWDMEHPLREPLSLVGHKGPVAGLAFSPDGQRLASAGWDRTVKVWELARGREVLSLLGHTHWVTGVAFHPDGRQLASVGDDGTVRVWDARAAQDARAMVLDGGPLAGVAFSPDGRRLAVAGYDHTVKVVGAENGEEICTLRGHAGLVAGVAFSPDGRLLGSASYDGTVKLWDPTTGRQIRTLQGHAGPVTGVAFSPDGRRLASGGEDQTIRIWDAATGQALQSLCGHGGGVTGVAFSPDGRLLAAADKDHTVRLWNPATGRVVHSLGGHDKEVTAVAFSPDGRWLASAGQDQTARIWEVSSGEPLQVLAGHDGGLKAVAFSPDGRRLATASADKTVKIWDTATGWELLNLGGHGGPVEGVAFRPGDGQCLASVGLDKTLRIWEAPAVPAPSARAK